MTELLPVPRTLFVPCFAPKLVVVGWCSEKSAAEVIFSNGTFDDAWVLRDRLTATDIQNAFSGFEVGKGRSEVAMFIHLQKQNVRMDRLGFALAYAVDLVFDIERFRRE